MVLLLLMWIHFLKIYIDFIININNKLYIYVIMNNDVLMVSILLLFLCLISTIFYLMYNLIRQEEQYALIED
jgi:hypothetical protein